ncbi:MAG: hypothetical protein GF372_06560 [Candidatus Marinimicrobia bacterium]|nr:hypothetical protein [Candidatus Neomarinimicrobiota bacterium]
MKNIINWIIGATIVVVLASVYILVIDLIEEGHLVTEVLGIVGLIVVITAMVLMFQGTKKEQST